MLVRSLQEAVRVKTALPEHLLILLVVMNVSLVLVVLHLLLDPDLVLLLVLMVSFQSMEEHVKIVLIPKSPLLVRVVVLNVALVQEELMQQHVKLAL